MSTKKISENMTDISNENKPKEEKEKTSLPKIPPFGPRKEPFEAFSRMVTLLKGLLDPTHGCPWDLVQTPESISEDILEETYELREALLEKSKDKILEEAGDLTFLTFFLSTLLDKSSYGFGLLEIMDGAVDKMVYRHPHVFKKDDDNPKNPEEVLEKWHALKRAQKKKKEGLLDSVPVDLPALARCNRLGAKAGRVGFDWKNAIDVREKITEELKELDLELNNASYEKDAKNIDKISEEIGDLLSATVSLARHMGLSAEKCLQSHNQKFVDRVKRMEESLKVKNKTFEDLNSEELEELWQISKRS
jgi:MazG family protein